ncbi:MAG: sugar kinase [Pseudomonadota bacterium]
MTKVACIGEAMIEVSAQGTNARLGVAGDTLNTAIYLKRAAPQVTVDYITRLGDDPFSDQIAAFIAQEGIGTAPIRIERGGSPGLYAITTDDAGERTFTYWRAQAAARGLFADGDFSILSDYDLLYLSGISIAILPPNVRAGLLDAIQQSPALLAFDSNFRPRLWEDKTPAAETISAYWEACDIPRPSIEDEANLFDETETQVIERWQAATQRGALKRGGMGPMSIGAPVDQTYASVDNVIDTTAAGDSFCGGYLAARLTGSDQAEALRAGHDQAARVIQHPGAIIPR